jgi:tetratricopeptide (TPR) repeat protein
LYGLGEVEHLLRLPRSTIRSLVKAGFVSPLRGARGALQFSFQDLVVLRKAQALAAARVPHRRIVRAMKELRAQAESGQYALEFGSLSVMAPMPSARELFDQAARLERKDRDAAAKAYEQAIAADPSFLDARINLGLLLHQSGRMAKAERAYRDAILACGRDPTLLYNLGVLLEDMGRKRDALEAYRAALRADPAFADCHYNLALLYEDLGKPKEAIRHMAQYRRLARR